MSLNPDYYKLWSDMRPFELHKKILTREEYIGFLKGNILKYQMRLGNKDSIEKEQAKITTYKAELEELLKPEELPF